MNGVLTAPPAVLRLAGHPIRWSLLTRLARFDYRGQELGAWLQVPQNLVSYHLGQLRAGKFVTERKSSADERSVYYSLDVERFRVIYLQAGEQLHPAVAGTDASPGAETPLGTTPEVPLRVLFLRTHNSARSQMAEALLR